MDTNIYCGRGNAIPYDELMRVLNTSFGFFTPETEFLGLLPKLYREQYRPQDQNWVVTEDGVLAAAIGAYDHEINVCGRRLPCRGVGNVAVHPDHRHKGYMKLAMDQAIADMVKDGIVLSTLGGRRQRYQYFGYDKAGPAYHFSISRDNIRHTYGDAPAPFAVRTVTDPADPAIDEIIALSEQSRFVPTRDRAVYLDIANTWKARLMVLTDPAEGDRFVGYCICDGGSLSELRVVRGEDFMGLVRSVYACLDQGFTVGLPAYETEQIKAISLIAEGIAVHPSMMYLILNYAATIEAFLALKLTYATLPDGELTLLIHGHVGDERLRIAVKEGKHTVETVSEDVPVDMELGHLEATELLFGCISADRETASPLLRAWFPLPLWMYRADEV